MTGWLISIVGISFLTILLDILIKDSENMKYIKSIYSIIVVYVIIFPVITFINQIKNADFSNVFKDVENNYLYQISLQEIDLILNEDDINNYTVSIKENTVFLTLYQEVSQSSLDKIENLLKKYDKQLILKLSIN